MYVCAKGGMAGMVGRREEIGRLGGGSLSSQLVWHGRQGVPPPQSPVCLPVSSPPLRQAKMQRAAAGVLKRHR